jgi:hypothetical protein
MMVSGSYGTVEGRETHQLETFWHFAPDLDVVKTGHAFVAQPKQPSLKDARLALLPMQDSGWTSELKPGFVSPAYGRKEPAVIMASSIRVPLPAEHASLLVPLLRPSDEPGTFFAVNTQGDSAGGGACAYRYDGLGKSHLMIFAGEEQSWTLGWWTSDSRFIYCGLEDGRVTHFILCGGSFVKLLEKSVFTHSQKVERLEWTKRAGTSQVFCSTDGAIPSFSESTLESSDSVF